jgi:hypothetical protein
VHHDRGLFDGIRVKYMRNEIASWEVYMPAVFAVCHLCCTSSELARTSRTNLEVCRSDLRPLGTRRAADNGIEVLPPNLKAMWVVDPRDNEETSL